MSSQKTSSLIGERIFQIFLVLIGAVIALISTYVAQYSYKNERRIETASIIQSSVEREIHQCKGMMEFLNRDRDAKFDGHYFVGSFQYIHISELLITIMPNLSNLKREVIDKFNIYFLNLKQCQSFRDLLVKNLENSGFKPLQTGKEVNAYLISLEALIGSGEKLILSLDKHYLKCQP
jgi:hypothetical protein